MQFAIDIRALGKRYKDVAALDGVTASIPMGKVVGLLGHNGAGKSTLIKLLLGLSRPTSGSVVVLGQSPWGRNAALLRRRLGYLPENVAFYGNLTGAEVLDYLARLKRAPREQVDRLLERVGLADARDRRVATYSKGMRQRLGLAQALLGTPELVMLDEPTSGLDPQATDELYAVLAELRVAGRSVLVSSHLLAEIEPHLDAALILRRGELLAHGDLAALRRQAGLSDLICVRLKDTTDSAVFTSELRAQGSPCLSTPDGQVEVQVVGGDKLDLLQRLAWHPAVDDIVVREASLARIYAHLGAGSPPKEDAACRAS